MVLGASTAEEAIIRLVVKRMGPAGRIVMELWQENQRLQEENAGLRSFIAAQRPIKGRSPAEWRFRILRYEDREMVIHPRDGSGPKTIRTLRVHVPLEDKLEDVPYWDVTSKRLDSILRPILPMLVGTGRYVRLTKVGEGPTSSWAVQVEPPRA